MTVVLQEIVFGLGILTAIIQFMLCAYFLRVKSYFAMCFAMTCLADASASIATTLFSASSVLGIYGQLSPELVITLRGFVFIPLLASSLFLAWKVWKA